MRRALVFASFLIASALAPFVAGCDEQFPQPNPEPREASVSDSAAVVDASVDAPDADAAAPDAADATDATDATDGDTADGADAAGDAAGE